MNRIVIPLDNGYKLVAEQNSDNEFNKEIFVGIETEAGVYIQDLVIVRPTYKCQNDEVKFDSDTFEMLVFGQTGLEDFTDKFTVGLYKDE